MGIYHNAVRLNQRWKVITPSISEFAFIIGAMKAGTSTLWSYLIQHPSICKCLFKEPNFWSNPSDPPDLASYYRLWLPHPLRHQIALEASPCYTASGPKLSVAEKLRHLPGKKHFIYLVRDPVSRATSRTISARDGFRLMTLSHSRISPNTSRCRAITGNSLIIAKPSRRLQLRSWTSMI